MLVGFCNMPQNLTTWDRQLHFSEGSSTTGFIAPKNPVSSAGYEPVNLESNGNNATARPPRANNTVLEEVAEIIWSRKRK
jgi:hypothetical protein